MIESPVREASEETEVRSRRLRGWLAVGTLGAGLVLVVVAAVHALAQTLIPPLAVFGLLAAVVIVLLWRGLVRAGGVLGVLLALALVLPDPQGLLTGLSLVRDPFEFTLNATGLTAALLLLVSGIVMVARGRAAAERGALTRTLLVLGALALPLALAVSVILRVTMPTPEAQPGDVAVAIEEFEFPGQLTAASGPVAFHVTNADPVAHTFTVPELGISGAVPGGATVRITGEARPGTYEYVCRVAGHEFMRGTLTVAS